MHTTIKKIFLLIAYCSTVFGMDQPTPENKVEAFTTKKWVPKLSLECKALVFAMAYSRDNTKLAVGRCGANELYIYDTTYDLQHDNKKFWRHDTLYNCPDSSALAYSPDDKWLAVGCNAKKTKIFNTTTWESKTILEHDGNLVSLIRYSHNGKQLALHLRLDQNQEKSKICIFNTTDWQCEKIFDHTKESIRSFAYTPDDATLWIKFLNGTSKVFETKSWECLAEVHSDSFNTESLTWADMELLEEAGREITSIERSFDGKQLAIGSMLSGARSQDDITHGKVSIFELDTPDDEK